MYYKNCVSVEVIQKPKKVASIHKNSQAFNTHHLTFNNLMTIYLSYDILFVNYKQICHISFT